MKHISIDFLQADVESGTASAGLFKKNQGDMSQKDVNYIAPYILLENSREFSID